MRAAGPACRSLKGAATRRRLYCSATGAAKYDVTAFLNWLPSLVMYV